MRYVMKKTVLGSPDGLNVYEYQKGEEYGADTRPVLKGKLAEVFVQEGWAEEVQEKQKSAKGPSENKATEPKKNKSEK